MAAVLNFGNHHLQLINLFLIQNVWQRCFHPVCVIISLTEQFDSYNIPPQCDATVFKILVVKYVLPIKWLSLSMNN